MGTLRNKQKWHLVVAFLNASGKILSDNAKDNIINGRVKPTDGELYVRSAVTPGGKINLLEGKSVSQVGVTNFDGNHLKGERNFVIDAITINYGVAATNTSPAAVNYNQSLPAALKNSEIVVRQAGVVLFRLPISAINDAKSSDERYRELAGFQLLLETSEIEIELDTPAGADFGNGADTAYVEVVLRGMETHIRRQ